MQTKKNHKLYAKVWIEHKGTPLIGKGGANILLSINKTKSISKASSELNMSYRYVWNYIKKIEKTIGKKIIDTYKGGKFGGGGAELTELGASLLEEYKQSEEHMKRFLESSVRDETIIDPDVNELEGRITLIEKDKTKLKIKIEGKKSTEILLNIPTEPKLFPKVKTGDKIRLSIKASKS